MQAEHSAKIKLELKFSSRKSGMSGAYDVQDAIFDKLVTQLRNMITAHGAMGQADIVVKARVSGDKEATEISRRSVIVVGRTRVAGQTRNTFADEPRNTFADEPRNTFADEPEPPEDLGVVGGEGSTAPAVWMRQRITNLKDAGVGDEVHRGQDMHDYRGPLLKDDMSHAMVGLYAVELRALAGWPEQIEGMLKRTILDRLLLVATIIRPAAEEDKAIVVTCANWLAACLDCSLNLHSKDLP